VIVGRDLKNELNLRLGDRIAVVLPSGLVASYIVSGFYDLGVSNINKSWVITDLETVQRLFDYGNRVTSIEMTVDSVFEADTVAHEIGIQLANDNLKIENWKSRIRSYSAGSRVRACQA